MMGGSVGDEDLKQVWGLLMKGVLCLMCVAAFLGGCAYFNEKAGLKDDNVAEDFLEDMVEFHLGLPKESLDFTPDE